MAKDAKSLKRLLVPVDLSEPAKNALAAAKAIALETGATLELAYVYEYPPTILIAGDDSGLLERQWKEYRRGVVGELEKLTEGLPKAKVRVRVHEGVPAAVLGRLSRSGDYSLAVVGTHGYTGVRHAVFGSVAESLVNTSSIPVLTVPLKSRLERPKRILVPYNMTGYADAALRQSLLVADGYGAAVTALYVVGDGEGAADALGRLKDRLTGALGADEARRVAAVVSEGPADRGILEEAVAGRHDLIVLSAHRKSFLEAMVLGTTADRVLRHSPVPVLSIPSDAS